ncbi:MAG: hypothetical protein CMM18_05750 [Rhodospirillaceae bacterium]|nr:hypothetical protein [Rhodospirillaceae bacterium]
MKRLKPSHDFFKFIYIRRLIIILLFGGILSSCSMPVISSIPSVPTVPNWVKPSNALKKVSSIFSRYKSERNEENEDKKISLEDVPKRPKSLIMSNRSETISGLRSDNKNAKYIDELKSNSNSDSKSQTEYQISKVEKNKKESNLINRKISNIKKDASNDSLNSRRIITSGKRSSKTAAIDSQDDVKIIEPKSITNRDTKIKTQTTEAANAQRELKVKSKLSSEIVSENSKKNEPNLDQRIKRNSNNFGKNTLRTTFSKLIAQSSSKVSNVPIGSQFQSTKAKILKPDETLAMPVIRELYNSSIVIDSSSDEVANIKKIENSEMNVFSFSGTENSVPSLTINFAHDSRSLSSKDKMNLKQLVKDYGSKLVKIIVVGHASSRTRDMNIINHQLVNFKISVDRAQSVVNELIDLSISPSSIKVEAKGSSEPKYFESMPSGEAANRRAEVFIIESSS